MTEPAVDITPEKIAAADPWYWARANQLKILGGRYRTFGYEYLVEPLRAGHRKLCAKKGTQDGWTQDFTIREIHRCIFGIYKQGVLYLFPTAKDVARFSNSRFKPMIKENPESIGRFVTDTDQENLKKFGEAFFYFVGAKMPYKTEAGEKDRSGIKGFSVDSVVFDEFDEMPDEARPLAIARMGNSEHKNEIYLANPTVPGYGIDALYNLSDQRVWMIKCDKCGRYTCMELAFPSCLERLSNGKVIRLCTKCRDRELYPKNGIWVARHPENKDMAGYWGSNLMSVRSDMTELLNDYENPKTDLTNFHNLRLGMAHVAAENKLTRNQVLALCGTDPMSSSHVGPCAMGVDVGKDLHVVICSIPYQSGKKLEKAARVTNFTDVHDLAVKFNVKVAVFDLKPETRKVREFRAAAAKYQVFGCDYQENQRGVAAWDEKSGVVTINRTEILDASHALVTTVGKYQIPRRDDEIDIYATQMCNTARILEVDKDTGSKTYRYLGKLGGPDDYRHATNYMILACDRMLAAGGGAVAISVPGEVQKAAYKYD